MKQPAGGIPIAVVEQETGLSKDVLRKWETRYNYPVPARNEHGDRVYSQEQVARLRTIKRLMDGGYRPSKLFGMDEGELSELALSPRSAEGGTNNESVVSELLELLRAHQPARFRATLTRLLQGQGLKGFVQDTMAPLSAAVGEAWSRGELRVFEEHLFSEIASATLRQALDAIDTPEGRPRILMTTLPGEVHSLGLLMAACLFTMQGAHCIYLGTETPGEDIAQATQAHDVDAVALSFSGAFPARQIQPALLGLRQQISGNIEILAGGVGIRRQRPLEGVLFMKDFASVDEYVAKHLSA
jgi:DNA-binding transcriptional MerR regulator/methylmalonyl-CoA mutase cobalamin-binding subunit